MIGLAGLLAVALLLVVVAIRSFRRQHALSPASLSVKDLLEKSILGLVSVQDNMGELLEIFRPDAYAGVVAEPFPWTAVVRQRLRERVERAEKSVLRMDRNIATWERLGINILALGEDEIAREITRKATACRLLLRPVKLRVRLYNRAPLFMWLLFGRKMANTCLYGGRALVFEYTGLAEAVLAFARAQGDDHHYETLLSVF